VAVTPGWAGPGGTFGLLYRRVPNAFGRAPALRCPFFSASGKCDVWRHRPGVCATWHCKHVRGDTGHRFWKLADELLREVEQDLAVWCLAELKFGSAAVDEASASPVPHVSELDGEIDWVQYRKLWGQWAGREAELYRVCARLVEPLTWDQVERACGPRVRILAGFLQDGYTHLTSQAIPERLEMGNFQFNGTEGTSYRIVTYSVFDPLLMPEALARALRYFDGRPTEDALEAILAEQGVRLDLSLVRRMVDFGLLKPCEPEKNVLPILG